MGGLTYTQVNIVALSDIHQWHFITPGLCHFVLMYFVFYLIGNTLKYVTHRLLFQVEYITQYAHNNG